MKKIRGIFIKIKQAFFNCMFKYRYATVMTLVGVIVVFWDLFLKSVTDQMNEPLINGIISVFSTKNTGAAWSIFSNNTTGLIVVTAIILCLILIANLFYKNKDYFYSISFGMVFWGAMCNLFDRIKYGYVRDFIKLEFINFPIFNIADIAITVGVILLCVYFVFIVPRKKNIKPEEVVRATQFINDYKIANKKKVKGAKKVAK